MCISKIAMPPFEPRYKFIDALRGLAALGVVVFHLEKFSSHVSHLATLCVVAFFVVSGYCIGSAVQNNLKVGVSFRSFYFRRFRRIYPPYVLSVLFFVATRVALQQYEGVWRLTLDPVTWLQNITLTQWLTLLVSPEKAPTANPSLFIVAHWSLNYEEQFYAVMGLIMLYCSLRPRWALWLPIALMGLSFATLTKIAPYYYGFFIEMWVPFAVGVVVFHRLCGDISKKMRKGLDVLLVIVLAYSIALAIYGNKFGIASGVYLYSALASAIALLLVALRKYDRHLMDNRLGVVLSWLGLISYSLYLTHQFNLGFSYRLASLFIRFGLPPWLGPVIQLGILVSIATAFWWACERPFLNRRLVVDPRHSNSFAVRQSR